MQRLLDFDDSYPHYTLQNFKNAAFSISLRLQIFTINFLSFDKMKIDIEIFFANGKINFVCCLWSDVEMINFVLMLTDADNENIDMSYKVHIDFKVQIKMLCQFRHYNKHIKISSTIFKN